MFNNRNCGHLEPISFSNFVFNCKVPHKFNTSKRAPTFSVTAVNKHECDNRVPARLKLTNEWQWSKILFIPLIDILGTLKKEMRCKRARDKWDAAPAVIQAVR